jgi:hypothetical protein
MESFRLGYFLAERERESIRRRTENVSWVIFHTDTCVVQQGLQKEEEEEEKESLRRRRK